MYIFIKNFVNLFHFIFFLLSFHGHLFFFLSFFFCLIYTFFSLSFFYFLLFSRSLFLSLSLILSFYSLPLKSENCWSNKPRNICQPQKPQRRPCSELLKYLTANDDSPQTKSTESRTNNRFDKCTKKKPCLHPQPHFQGSAGIHSCVELVRNFKIIFVL